MYTHILVDTIIRKGLELPKIPFPVKDAQSFDSKACRVSAPRPSAFVPQPSKFTPLLNDFRRSNFDLDLKRKKKDS